MHIIFLFLISQHASVNRDGTQIAVAGQYGIALYNSVASRWKVFGDRNQEKNIRALALSWYRSNVIIANEPTHEVPKPP